MKNILGLFILTTLTSFASPLSYGNAEDNNIHFHPVQEVVVDELPESIADLEFVHSTSKLPVVFRGAAKNWEAMNWTPEKFDYTNVRKQRGDNGSERKTDQMNVYFSKKNGRTTSLDHLPSAKLDFEDLGFFEKNIYEDITEIELAVLKQNAFIVPNDSSSYVYFVFTGTQGYQDEFHRHESVLLAEFYGEKIVFLSEPRPGGEGLDYEEYDMLYNESNKIITDLYDNDYNDFYNTNANKDYSPYQQVILRPGDVLYIPSGWYHKIHYLTPCIGAAQFIPMSRINI